MIAAPPLPDSADVDPVVQEAFLWACQAELAAVKPGNVHVHAPGHRMTVADFETSARVAAPHIARRGATVGRRIRDAMTATVAAVGTNTNLGILLLAAPLAAAFERGGPLRASLSDVLAGLTVEDAVDAFAAIRLASPGGLGSASRHDVAAPPEVDLRAAMAEAAERDRIARQYVTVFEDVFEIGLPALGAARTRRLADEQATVATYLALAAAFPDTHVQRKFGAAVASRIQEEFAGFAAGGAASDHEALLAFDTSLKARGINPGTSADLTVATLMVMRLC
ncbi:triphosphoribosyl-dephospho-CoA synthase [Methylobrevis pamukkalensis]|uniref:Triphosphoribosyl-dephospho-CoA synthase n=1 Tax=Methylobrevis pamukkalensis TaxID=1439726 RepID=A0A1E3H4W0_9HYPH|nr:triphosphoribosyl-dephospho-CoA synthase [Methylobrevis pamukkalensis]ODN71363.1 triphosphoribosyl-dephospho-CoA synthase [Methylobrevis pamukkalensis]